MKPYWNSIWQILIIWFYKIYSWSPEWESVWSALGWLSALCGQFKTPSVWTDTWGCVLMKPWKKRIWDPLKWLVFLINPTPGHLSDQKTTKESQYRKYPNTIKTFILRPFTHIKTILFISVKRWIQN